MANINLVTDREESKMFGTGTIALLTIFFVTILVYGGMFYYGNKLGNDVNASKEEYTGKFSSFTAGDAKRVLDFQNRLAISTDLLTQERNVNQDFEKIEALMLTGVYLDSYVYDDASKSIKLDCFADSYDSVAKQILSFKSESYFASVLAGETKFDLKSKRIGFPVVLTIK